MHVEMNVGIWRIMELFDGRKLSHDVYIIFLKVKAFVLFPQSFVIS